MENLLELQTLQLESAPHQRGRPSAMEAIRKTIPSLVLVNYDRLLARGKKGVATVRNGVCTECHIGVAIGALAGLAQEGDIRACGNCGCYLFLPPNQPVIPVILPPPVKAKSVRRKKESLAHAG
jgi:predicted  nucleic acid-binding Zn-ribbon protein